MKVQGFNQFNNFTPQIPICDPVSVVPLIDPWDPRFIIEENTNPVRSILPANHTNIYYIDPVSVLVEYSLGVPRDFHPIIIIKDQLVPVLRINRKGGVIDLGEIVDPHANNDCDVQHILPEDLTPTNRLDLIKQIPIVGIAEVLKDKNSLLNLLTIPRSLHRIINSLSDELRYHGGPEIITAFLIINICLLINLNQKPEYILMMKRLKGSTLKVKIEESVNAAIEAEESARIANPLIYQTMQQFTSLINKGNYPEM